MASQDETIRLKIMAESVGVDQAQASIAKLHKATETYFVQTETANSAAIKFARSINLTTQSANVEAVARKANTAAHIAYTESLLAADRAARKSQGGMRDFGMGVLFASQAIEDAQYGFSAVLNNIPLIVMAMGGSGGLAGTISIVGVGVAMLTRHWDTLAGAFGKGHVKTQAEEMKELGEQTAKTADELKRVLDYKERERGAEKIMGTAPEKETKATAAVAQVLTELSDVEKSAVARKLAKGHEDTYGLTFTAEEQRELNHAKELQKGNQGTGKDSGLIGGFGDMLRVGTGAMGLSETNEQRGMRLEAELRAKKRAQLEKEALNDLAIAGKNEHELMSQTARLREMGQNELANRMESAHRAATREFDDSAHPGQSPAQVREMRQAEAAADDEANAQRLEAMKQRVMIARAEAAADATQLAEKKEHEREKRRELGEIARAEIEADEAQIRERQARLDADMNSDAGREMQRRVQESEAAGQAAEQNMQGALGNAAELGFTRTGRFGMGTQSTGQDTTTMRLFQAQQRGMAEHLNTPAKRKAFMRMTMEDRLGMLGKENDALDKQAVGVLTNDLMKTGLYSSRETAEKVAQAQVMTARDRINGFNGDPATKAQEELKMATSMLTAVMERISRNGVNLMLAN